jgi:hypothetical protein
MTARQIAVRAGCWGAYRARPAVDSRTRSDSTGHHEDLPRPRQRAARCCTRILPSEHRMPTLRGPTRELHASVNRRVLCCVALPPPRCIAAEDGGRRWSVTKNVVGRCDSRHPRLKCLSGVPAHPLGRSRAGTPLSLRSPPTSNRRFASPTRPRTHRHPVNRVTCIEWGRRWVRARGLFARGPWSAQPRPGALNADHWDMYSLRLIHATR